MDDNAENIETENTEDDTPRVPITGVAANEEHDTYEPTEHELDSDNNEEDN